MAIEWSVVVELEGGRSFTEIVASENAANTRINQLKGQASGTWATVGDIHIKGDKIIAIRKAQAETGGGS